MSTFDTMESDQGIEKTVVRPAAGSDATLLGATVVCQVCGTENAPGEKYCGECGFLLSSSPGESPEAIETVEQARLVESGGGREFMLRQGENSVGRENTDVLLADPTVSRRHALLVIESGAGRVEDLGSTNGTYVAGRQIRSGETAELLGGEELKFGSAAFTIILPAASSEPETPVEQVVDVDDGGGETSADIDVSDSAVETEPEPYAEAELTNEESPAVVPAEVSAVAGLYADGREFDVMYGRNTIGRRAENSIAITDDPYVSGSHAEIDVDERGYWLTDVGSTNGTLINEARIEPNVRMALGDGDEITFGRTSLKFMVLDKFVADTEYDQS